MGRLHRLFFLALGITLAGAMTVTAQTTKQSTQPSTTAGTSSKFTPHLGVTLGAQTIDGQNWQSLGLQPDFSFGKFGVGLDITLRYMFTGSGSNFKVRKQDWVPSPANFSTVTALYLPKIAYLRYGHPSDPLYVKLGSLGGATLGNGFVVGGYTNMQFLPATRMFGLDFNLDGSLFKFPYLGIQTFSSNVLPVYNLPTSAIPSGEIPAFDIVGVGLYGRPLIGLDLPIIKHLQITGIMAADRSTATPAVVYGGDVMVPIISSPVVSLATMGSVAFENQHPGAMVGVAGRLIKFITYGAQIRYLGSNFIPDYFGPNYDLYRSQQYATITGPTVPGSIGWFASAGFSLLSDKLVFNASLQGPFKAIPTSPTDNPADYPHLIAMFTVAPGVIPGFYLDATFDKQMITSFPDVFTPDNSVIGASINYKAGPAVITLTYNLKYSATIDPVTGSNWTVNSGLSSSISLF